MLFFRQISHLLPRGQTWSLTINKVLRKFFLGLSEQPQETRDFVDKVYLDLFPATARSKDDPDPAEASGALEEWEKQFGLVPSDPANFDARRLALAAEWRATGGQSPGYLQDVLQVAGFDVYVHEWWNSGPPYVARNPLHYTVQPLLSTERCRSLPTVSGKPRCTTFKASESRCNRFLNNDPHYIVNKDLTRRAPPPVPDDPTKWPYFIYIGGPTFDDGATSWATASGHATVDITRRDEFERLLLKLRPTHNWIVLLVDYEASGFVITEGGDTIIEEDGDTIVAEA